MRINFELLDLRAFLAVIDLGGFHKAADNLALSQPALSRRIQGLEASLGAPLRVAMADPTDLNAYDEVSRLTRREIDLAVVAEGGVFADQARKSLARDYQQNAWVGTVTLSAESPAGVAYERFTRNGPLALLPLGDGFKAVRSTIFWQ